MSQFTHEHGGEGVHEHGPGETHSHVRESFEAHGHFHEEDLEALMAQDMSINEADISGINPGWMVLNSVGIDIGSSTSHLTFSRLFLERRGLEMSSRFVTVRRDVLYRSPILLTSYVDIETIDVARLSAFVRESYELAGVDPSQIHTGAVICTGEAVKKKNAEAITRLFSQMGGRFVCATAGPRLEAILAAHGSGSVARSHEGKTVMNIDLGGGTTKVTVSQRGAILETGAINVGARLMAWTPKTGLLNRIELSGRMIANSVGIEPAIGQRLSAEQKQLFARTLAELLVEYVTGGPRPTLQLGIAGDESSPLSPTLPRQGGGSIFRPESDLAAKLEITGPLEFGGQIDEIIFSGGVGEYIYDHDREDYGDFGPLLAGEIRQRFGDLPAPVAEGVESIRATVIGASQYTVQVSSSTIFLSDPESLPLRDYQVVVPRFGTAELDHHGVASAITGAMARYDLLDEDTRHPVALYLDWPHETSYTSLSTLASGIVQALTPHVDGHPWVLIFERDIGALVGAILKEDMQVPNEVVAVDEVEVSDLDFVDVGQLLGNRSAVPVVVKSLIFE